MKRNRLLTIMGFVGILGISNITLAAQPAAPTPTNNALTPAQVKQVQNIIRSYLIKNPEILVAASEALQQKAMKKAEVNAKSAIKKYSKELFNDPNSPIAGNPNGKVNFVEFMDYQCGHCRVMAPAIAGILNKNKNVRYIVKELPIFGDDSTFAAQIALAAYKQNPKNFETLHEALFKLKRPITNQSILDAATSAGYNASQLQNTIKTDKTIAEQIKNNFTLAQELGIIGTPTFVIANRDGSNTSYIPGATPEQNLETLLQKAAG